MSSKSSDSSGSSKFLKLSQEDYKDIKKTLLKQKKCSKKFKTLGNEEVLKSANSIYQFFFRPLTFKPKQIDKLVADKDEEFLCWVSYVTEWYYKPKDNSFKAKIQSLKKFLKFIQNAYLPVKLIICELDNVHPFGRWLYKLQNTIFPSEFGLVHVGIQVGPFVVDWNATEVIIPRPLKIKNPICILDLTDPFDYNSGLRCDKDTLFKIASVIHKWNTRYTYTNAAFKILEVLNFPSGNCHCFYQDFTEEMKLQKDGEFWWHNKCEDRSKIDKYLEELKKKDKKARKSKKKEKFNKRKWIMNDFKTHKELDDYFKKNKGPQNLENVLFSERYALFKAWDRSFWIRKKQDKKYDAFKHCPLIKKNMGMFAPHRATKDLKKEEKFCEEINKVDKDEDPWIDFF